MGALPVGDPAGQGIGCEQPNVLACAACDHRLVVKCGTARTARCEPCGSAHRGRVGVVAGSGFRGAPTRVNRRGQVVSTSGLFLTITRPGDKRHRRPDGEWCACTHLFGRTRGESLAEWNASTGMRFNRFMMALRREYSKNDPTRLVYFKGTETQKSGGIHFHILLKWRDGGPIRMSTARVRELAMQYGFGHSVDLQRFAPDQAAYVAKYASKAADARDDVPWSGRRRKVTRAIVERVDYATGELTTEVEERSQWVPSSRPTYRTWTASRGYGDAMRDVRAAQLHYAVLLHTLPAWGGGAVDPLGLARCWRLLPRRLDVPASDLGPPDV